MDGTNGYQDKLGESRSTTEKNDYTSYSYVRNKETKQEIIIANGKISWNTINIILVSKREVSQWENSTRKKTYKDIGPLYGSGHCTAIFYI